MNKNNLKNFLLKARTKTYAGAGGKAKPAFPGSDQLEYREGDWLYRDVYYTGNGIFTGLETVYLQNRPIFAMSYYGNFKKLTEKEIDKILRKALIKNWKTARTWQKTEWKTGDYQYICQPSFPGQSINEMAGIEKIFKRGKEVYGFFYAGGIITK